MFRLVEFRPPFTPNLIPAWAGIAAKAARTIIKVRNFFIIVCLLFSGTKARGDTYSAAKLWNLFEIHTVFTIIFI